MILCSLLLGVPGFGMALGDLGKGRTIMDWILLGAVYFLFAGFLLGLIDAGYWYIAAAAAWGPMIVGAGILFFKLGQQAFAPISLLMPLGLALVGGFVGSTARSKIGAK